MVVDNIVSACIRKDKFSVSELEDAIQSNSDKGKIVSYNMCTGKRGPKEAGVEKAVECKEIINQK